MKINDSIIIKDHLNLEILRQKSENVPTPLNKEDAELLEDMLKYVIDSTNEEIALKENLKPAVGISAIQVGIAKKLIVIVIKDEEDKIIHKYALANPKIISHSIQKSYLARGEGCLSVDEKVEGYVYRSSRIKVKAYNYLTKQEETIAADDFLAIVFQHEIDHLNGILYYDHIDKEKPLKINRDAIRIE